MTEEYLRLKENALQIKRSISNIIWLDGEENFDGFLSMVGNSLYLSAVEVSFFNILQKGVPSDDEVLQIKKHIIEENSEISGVHNIFADIENFKESPLTSETAFQNVVERIERYIDIAKLLEVKHLSLDYMDFLNRGELSEEDADDKFSKLLERVDSYSNGEIDIHIVPTTDNVRDYIISYVQAIELLDKRNFKNIKVLIDLKEIFDTLSFDLKYFNDKQKLFSHFHTSNLDGGPMTFDDIPMHNKIVNVSHRMEHTNRYFVMKIKNLADEQKMDLANYNQFIHVFKEIYQVPIALSPFCSKLFPNLVYRHLSAEGPDVEHLFNYDQH
jgi:sugar phosphate isomerase/epimerase